MVAAGSCSPSLLESLIASLDEVLGSGQALAERLGAMTGMGSRRRVHPPKIPQAAAAAERLAQTPRPARASNHTTRQLKKAGLLLRKPWASRC
jgi:hypothetical protein